MQLLHNPLTDFIDQLSLLISAITVVGGAIVTTFRFFRGNINKFPNVRIYGLTVASIHIAGIVLAFITTSGFYILADLIAYLLSGVLSKSGIYVYLERTIIWTAFCLFIIFMEIEIYRKVKDVERVWV